MTLFSHFSLGSALLALGISAGTMTPLTIPTSASAQTTEASPASTSSFSDTSNYWARPFIEALAERNIIAGFPDGTFRPYQAVERAEFAAMIQKAFNQNEIRDLGLAGFSDVPADYWATSAIEEAYETGFMAGYPNNTFLPNLGITKAQALIALASGLNLNQTNASPANSIGGYYTDFEEIPSYARNGVAAATEANMVVNYPNVRVLNPTQILSRGEAAAILHQALVNQGRLQPISSNMEAANYIVNSEPNNQNRAENSNNQIVQ